MPSDAMSLPGLRLALMRGWRARLAEKLVFLVTWHDIDKLLMHTSPMRDYRFAFDNLVIGGNRSAAIETIAHRAARSANFRANKVKYVAIRSSSFAVRRIIPLVPIRKHLANFANLPQQCVALRK